jgi:hypothetical protein
MKVALAISLSFGLFSGGFVLLQAFNAPRWAFFPGGMITGVAIVFMFRWARA